MISGVCSHAPEGTGTSGEVCCLGDYVVVVGENWVDVWRIGGVDVLVVDIFILFILPQNRVCWHTVSL